MLKRITAALISLMLLLCGCNSDVSIPATVGESIVKGKPKAGGEISLYSFQQDTFNPLLTNIKANYDVLGLIFEPVVRNNPDGTIEGVLATSWTRSADGKKYTFDICDKAVFHDGEPLTPQDVATSIVMAATPQSPFYNGLRIVDKVFCNDDKVVVSLVEPVTSFPSLLEIPVMRAAHTKLTDGYLPVGTGPYVYDGSSESKTFDLVANEKWWQGKSYISKIKVKVLPDKASVTYAYDSGSIDAFATDVISAGKYAGDGLSRVKYFADTTLIIMGFNNLSIPFATAEARKSVASAIDKDKVNEEKILSNYIVTHTPINPQKKNYCDDVTVYSPAYKYDMQTQVMPFEILVCSSNSISCDIGEAIVKQLTDRGFVTTLVPVSDEEYHARIGQRQYDAFIGGFSLLPNDDLNSLLGGGNYFNYESDDIKAYLSVLPATDGGKLIESYNGLQHVYSSDLPFISLFYEQKALVVRNTVGGEILPLAENVYYNINNWFTETK
ncbi:MAG: ABC transporter substrate-binding protein [Eubacteriales bacterium]|nr:ABC transporter substrate-binding protein [Eubacteriales bacterium]